MRQTDVILVLAILAVAGVATGMLKIPGITFAAGTGEQGGVPTEEPPGCEGGSTYNAYAAVRNPDSASIAYLNNALRLHGADGLVITTGTAAGGTTGTQTTLTVPCTKKVGTLYALGSATLGTGSKVSFSSASQVYELLAKNATQGGGRGLVILARDNALTNNTAALFGDFNVNAIVTDAITVGSGGSVSGYLDLQINSSAAQFGATDGGIVVSADYSTSKFSQNAITLSGFGATKVTCPDSAVRLRGADSCWTMPAIKSSDGLVRLTYNIKADLGDPGATDDVAFMFDDKDYFLDTDGTVKLDIADAASTNVAQIVTNATINLA